jgi:outer membrane protein OmpA-like peptidoglycan-associated protein
MPIPTRAALCAALGLLMAAPAFAEPSRLQVIVGGEAYDGPPRFLVTFAGEPLGEGVVTAAIDTARVGRFAAARDRGAHVEAFDFEIPEAVFKPDGEVRLKLVNDASGGEGSGRDRNLFLAAIAVNGRAVTISGFATATAAGFADNDVLGEFLVLADGSVEAVGAAPEGGWPSPAGAPPEAVAAVPPPAEPVAAATAPAGDGCAPTRYNVLGFNESSNDVTPRIVERLEQVLADIGERRCTILITGYSSASGAHATNALFALERAQNVLTYLRGRGVAAVRMTASGGGATDRFGPAPADNRRVVITLAP